MEKLSVNQIKEMALEIVASHPGGIRYSQLRKMIKESSPDTSENTIHGAIWNLDAAYPDKISKPSRGLFVPVNGEQASNDLEPIAERSDNIRESDFYEKFADYLTAELDEATDAIAMGGTVWRKKWGTPDVVGVYRSMTKDTVRFQPEIISAEIKIDPSQPVVAFGQAIAYRLFSTKTYICMPNNINEEDLGMLESLCMLFGIGLILFALDVESPDFTIRGRAQRFYPDMFYVNEFANTLRSDKSEVFDKLFS